MENLLPIKPELRLQRVEDSVTSLDPEVFGQKIGILASLFGCWHENLSRPITRDGVSYRACLDCGSRKPFDPQTLRTKKGFYYPPIVRKIEC